MPAEPPAAMNMPMAQNKGQVVGRTQAPQKYQPSTVRSCMYWPENEPKQKGKGKKGKGGNKKQEVTYEEPAPPPREYTQFLHGKGEVGKARTRGFDMTTPPPPERKNDETAIRALRGWSDSQPSAENTEQQQDGIFEETKEFSMYKDDQGRVQTKKKKEKKKDEGKKGLMSEYDQDVHMGEILSYRFGNEEAERRQRRQQKEEAKKDRAAADAADARKAMKKVKHTQASIARTNVNTEKYTKVEQDLWKMSKFTKNAQPAIDTKRKPFSQNARSGAGNNKTGNRGGSGITGKRNGVNDADDFGGPCLCDNGYGGYGGLNDDFADIDINTGSPDPYTGEYQMMNEGPYDDAGGQDGMHGEYCEC